ncbi:MAG: ROK family transcriptional regulator [Clostridia bacterium]|nr:ROK family transcriptional regulator [Clostridia bacterium]
MPKSNLVVGNIGLIKSLNKRNILNAIVRKGSISRTEIARRVRLAMPSVMRIVDDFVKDGIVIETGKGDSTGGRKPSMLSINPGARFFLGSTVLDEIKSIVTNTDGQILGSAKTKTGLNGGEDEIIIQLKANMDMAIAASGLAPKDIAYAGIGTPGMGFTYMDRPGSGAFAFWSKLSKETFKRRCQFEFPAVVENIAKVGALGELRYGNGKEQPDYLFIEVGLGVGMGVVRGGRLDIGVDGLAGEFGHTSINFAGSECYCGKRGCVESYCSVGALLQEYQRRRVIDGTPCERNPSMEDFAEAIEKEDPTALDVAVSCGQLLGLGISNAVNLYNPGAVIVGGDACGIPLYVESAFEAARKGIFMNTSRSVKLFIASQEKPTYLMGAVAIAIEHFFDEYCRG